MVGSLAVVFLSAAWCEIHGVCLGLDSRSTPDVLRCRTPGVTSTMGVESEGTFPRQGPLRGGYCRCMYSRCVVKLADVHGPAILALSLAILTTSCRCRSQAVDLPSVLFDSPVDTGNCLEIDSACTRVSAALQTASRPCRLLVSRHRRCSLLAAAGCGGRPAEHHGGGLCASGPCRGRWGGDIAGQECSAPQVDAPTHCLPQRKGSHASG